MSYSTDKDRYICKLLKQKDFTPHLSQKLFDIESSLKTYNIKIGYSPEHNPIPSQGETGEPGVRSNRIPYPPPFRLRASEALSSEIHFFFLVDFLFTTHKIHFPV